ncbi:MAG: phosphatase PAP2 family protein [Bacteroidota bacterium]
MLRCTILLWAVLFNVVYANAQRDSTFIKSEKKLIQQCSLPAALILSGILISDSQFEKDFQQDVNDRVGDDFNTSIDDYTRYVPIAQMYIADVAGIASKNHWFDQTKNMAISLLLTDLLTKRLKRGIYKERPNGFNAESFPSGHTSHAFTTASVLYEEFKDTSPLLAYSGYGFATATGSLRVLKNKHWVSDVLLGAGIGVMITKLVYHFDYLFQWNPFKESRHTVLLPNYTEGVAGVYFSVRF